MSQSTPVTLIDWAGVLGRGILGSTFLVAGLAKLTSPQAAATAVAEFGAPGFARPLLRFLPHLEVVVAVSLAFAVSAWFGAWAAATLLVIFIVAMLVNFARGRRPACNCFGQVRPAPIGAMTVSRNVLLLGLAGGLIAAGPPPDTTDFWTWFRALSTQGRLVVAVIGVTLFVILRAALRSYAGDASSDTGDGDADQDATPSVAPQAAARTSRAQAAVAAAVPGDPAPPRRPVTGRALTGNGLGRGTVAPAFALPDLGGDTHTIESLIARGKPVVLVFSSPGCESCQALVPRLPAQVAAHGDRVTLVLVSRDTVERNLAKLKEPGDLLVLRQRDYEVAEDYDITTSPAGIVVGTDGVIASPLAMGGLAVLDLIQQTAMPPDA